MPPIENVAGRIAAGTLGYIYGNLPGAVAADQLFGKFYKDHERQYHGPEPTPKVESTGGRRTANSSGKTNALRLSTTMRPRAKLIKKTKVIKKRTRVRVSARPRVRGKTRSRVRFRKNKK